MLYAATYRKSEKSLERFAETGISVNQCEDIEIVKRAVEVFNSTNEDESKHIPTS